ncbi:hypothetical protein J3E69DRAFT_332739 [Trichoderma sp. SZMC 28015]
MLMLCLTRFRFGVQQPFDNPILFIPTACIFEAMGFGSIRRTRTFDSTDRAAFFGGNGEIGVLVVYGVFFSFWWL